MVPYVFVSSTIDDLHHLRDALRDAIIDLAYLPVLSEYGDVGYLPTKSAVESCYLTMRECQLAVFIVGKRYGAVMEDGRSVTHTEFLAARDAQVPAIFLVDREILAYKKVFDVNRETTINLPGMDAADKTFALIDEVTRAAANNAVLGFSTVGEARSLLKGQLAHMTGDFLRRGQDPVKSDVREILAEIKTLRHELAGGTDRKAPLFVRAVRYLSEEANAGYREVVKVLYDTVEAAVPVLLKYDSFGVVIINAVSSLPQILPLSSRNEIQQYLSANAANVYRSYIKGPEEQADEPLSGFIAVDAARTQCVTNAKMMLDASLWHDEFRSEISAA